MPLTWENAEGEVEEIPNPVQVFSAFCVCYPDDGTPSFPERVARENAGPPVCNQIRDVDIDAAKRLGARNNVPGGLPAVLEGHRNAIGNRVSPTWRLFQAGDAEWENEFRPPVRSLLQYFLGIHGLGIASATKLLWLKRPHLIPICDSFVLENLVGGGQGVERALECISRIREIGRDGDNPAALDEVKDRLDDHPNGEEEEEDAYYDLQRLRILEALIWFHCKKKERRRYYGLLGGV